MSLATGVGVDIRSLFCAAIIPRCSVFRNFNSLLGAILLCWICKPLNTSFSNIGEWLIFPLHGILAVAFCRGAQVFDIFGYLQFSDHDCGEFGYFLPEPLPSSLFWCLIFAITFFNCFNTFGWTGHGNRTDSCQLALATEQRPHAFHHHFSWRVFPQFQVTHGHHLAFCRGASLLAQWRHGYRLAFCRGAFSFEQWIHGCYIAFCRGACNFDKWKHGCSQAFCRGATQLLIFLHGFYFAFCRGAAHFAWQVHGLHLAFCRGAYSIFHSFTIWWLHGCIFAFAVGLHTLQQGYTVTFWPSAVGLFDFIPGYNSAFCSRYLTFAPH